MNYYKRLTKHKGAPLHTDMEVTDGDEIYERLAELEDMIQDGRLWFTPYNGLRPNPFECAKRWEELWYEANCKINAIKEILNTKIDI